MKCFGLIILTRSVYSFSAGLLSLGQIFGSLITALISESLGRKATILVSCLPIMIGWLCLAMGNFSSILILGRFLVGLGMGIEGG